MDVSSVQVVEKLCSHCGGKLSYAPGTDSLVCEYCGTKNNIEVVKAQIEGTDLNEYLEGRTGIVANMQVLSVECSTCSAHIAFPPGLTAGNCAFCGNNLVLADAVSRNFIQPHALLPFNVNRKVALIGFQHWLNRLWFAPDHLKNYAQQDEKLIGIYIPYWVYSTEVYIKYSGERGDKKIIDGLVTQSDDDMTYQKVSGDIIIDYSNILVEGSNSLSRNDLESLEPWGLDDLVQFDGQFIEGFRAESNQIEVGDGWEHAKMKMIPEIKSAIRKDIGGNDQIISSYETSYGQQRFKLVLLPIWINSYRYNNKIYRFIINGRTGRIIGERPYSIIKIGITSIIAIALLIALYLLLQKTSGPGE